MAKKSGQNMRTHCSEAASFFKALGHPERLMLLCTLSEGEKTVSDLETHCEASQSQISQFLARMKAEGLVNARRDGNRVFYSIADDRIKHLVKAAQSVFCA